MIFRRYLSQCYLFVFLCSTAVTQISAQPYEKSLKLSQSVYLVNEPVIIELTLDNNPKGCAFTIDFGDRQTDTYVFNGLRMRIEKKYSFASDYKITVEGVNHFDSNLNFYFPCQIKFTQAIKVLDEVYKPKPIVIKT